MKLYCCPNCFNDSFLQSEIDVRSTKKGKCSFCQTNNISILEPEELKNLFEPVLDIYEKNEKGKSLFKLFQEDWLIFSQILNDDNLSKLLYKISGIDTNESYSPIYQEERRNIEQWEAFREELKHNNRFFPNNAPSIEMIRPFGKYLGKKLQKGNFLFRARVNPDDTPINIAEMGKPPKKKSTNGRANPIGIPYLYVASSPETAIAEIRGNKGEKLSIAKFVISEDLELADLRNPRITVTPFGLDDDELELIFTNLPFLELLGNELSKPIVPREANLEYLPSQYLSEIIKHVGFHGIIYKSSVSNGDNYVLFDDSKVQAVDVVQYEIIDIITKSEKI
jgi:hypothetical protein